MTRTTRHVLESKLLRLSQMMGQPLHLDYNVQGYRVESRSNNRDISPRSSPRDMEIWIEAGIDVLGEFKHTQEDDRGKS